MTLDPNKSKQGKLCLAEVHPQFIESLALVNEVSKAKGYELLNWIHPTTKCYFVSYLISAAMRHINKFLSGEDFNIEQYPYDHELKGEDIPIEGLHLEYAAYNLLMCSTLFRMNRIDLDDRKINKDFTMYPNRTYQLHTKYLQPHVLNDTVSKVDIEENKLIYLASAYTHKDHKQMEYREKIICQTAMNLINEGYNIYCPIAETAALAKYQKCQTNWEFWRKKDLAQLSKCDELWIYDGIFDARDSKGVKGEVKYALNNNILIRFVYSQGITKVPTPEDLFQYFKVKSLDELND